MGLAKFVRAGALLAGLLLSQDISAQQTPGQPVKEVQVGANAFTLAAPVPAWVDATPLPEITKPQPVVVRLMDSQFLVGPTPIAYTRRAVAINDTAIRRCSSRV